MMHGHANIKHALLFTRFTGTLLQRKSRYAGYYVQLTTPFPRCFFGENINEFRLKNFFASKILHFN